MSSELLLLDDSEPDEPSVSDMAVKGLKTPSNKVTGFQSLVALTTSPLGHTYDVMKPIWRSWESSHVVTVLKLRKKQLPVVRIVSKISQNNRECLNNSNV